MKDKNKLRNYSFLFILLSICCIVICGSIILVGGLSYHNPHEKFHELFRIEPIKKYILNILPSVK